MYLADMQMRAHVCVFGMLGGLVAVPAFGSVAIIALKSSLTPPQRLSTGIVWKAKGTDSKAGPLTFQFNVAPPGQPLALVKDFNVGTLKSGVWTSQQFVWVPTAMEGSYQIQVVVKDFTTGQTAQKTVSFQVNPLVSGSTPVVVKTGNPLVALFSAPSCAAGSSMRVNFQIQSLSKPAMTTPYQACHAPASMNFQIAGMYPKTTYSMFSQTLSGGGGVTNGPTVTFTTGSIPSNVVLPPFQQIVAPGPQTDTTDGILLLNPFQFGGGPIYANAAADLTGNVLWYYNVQPAQSVVLTRPLANGTFLTFQGGTAWNPAASALQYLRQTDLAGNLIRETNVGVLQQELLAKGDKDGGPCTGIAHPAPVGAGCLDAFSHEAIATLPNGYTAVMVDAERIYPAGTQGDTSGLPVDVVGNIVLVLDANWQLVWYFDAFEHAGGPPQLDINRAAVLGETCTVAGAGNDGCPPLSLLGTGIAPSGKDWLHGNSLYYWPQDKDLIFSSRHQDWVMKIDYNNGAGTANILWRLGPCGDFAFSNIYNDPWPWNSHQHEVAMENSGAGPMTIFDNGNTRVSPPGTSTGCMAGTGSGHSRGMAVTVDEGSLTVTPILSADLGVFSTADGSAQLLANGNYFYLPAVVFANFSSEDSYSIEIQPTPGTGTGTQVWNLQGPSSYRAWRMPDLYSPPTT